MFLTLSVKKEFKILIFPDAPVEIKGLIQKLTVINSPFASVEIKGWLVGRSILKLVALLTDH